MEQPTIVIQPFLFKALEKIAANCGKKYAKIASLCKDTADFIEKLIHAKAADPKGYLATTELFSDISQSNREDERT